MAKSPSLADNLGKHLECAVCLEQYTEPRVLPCLHSFCKKCLQGLLTQEGAIWKINCPTCRLNAELCTRNPCKLKGTQAGRKRPIISGEDFPATWKWTNRYTGRR